MDQRTGGARHARRDRRPVEIIGVGPFGRPAPRTVVGVARAGGLGVLDLGGGRAAALAALTDVGRWWPGRFGVRLPAGCAVRPGELPPAADTVLVDAAALRPATAPADLAAWARGRRVLVEVVDVREAEFALALGDELAAAHGGAGVHGLIARGSEAGGRIGEPTTAVLLQRLLGDRRIDAPVFASGGIGPHTAAAAIAAGAAGVVLDTQLALVREMEPPADVAAALAAMDGSETRIVEGHRVYARPDLPEFDLSCLDLAGLTARLGPGGLRTHLLPVGQDGFLAAALAGRYKTAGGVVRAVRDGIGAHLRAAVRAAPLAPRDRPPGAAVSRDYPVVQAPIPGVTDRASFAAVVAQDGGLPCVALGLLDGADASALLASAAERLGDRPWAAGIAGFVPPVVRAAQLAAVREARCPYALIDGGGPEEAAPLEAAGVRAYLYASGPGTLDRFLAAGVRRLVFAGAEGAVPSGAPGAFALWEARLARLSAFLDDHSAEDLSVLFGGGVHDERSGAMVAALAGPLAERGVDVRVLAGTAYLFTYEAVASGAITPGYQRVAQECDGTVVVGPVRCARTPAADAVTDDVPGRIAVAARGLRGGAPVEAAAQYREGLYPLGHAAALRSATTGVTSLHEHLTSGATRFLADRAAALTLDPDEPPAGPEPLDIAVIGMACVLPGAPDAAAHWSRTLRPTRSAPASAAPAPAHGAGGPASAGASQPLADEASMPGAAGGMGDGAGGSGPVAGGASMPGAGRGGAGGAVSLPPAGIGHGAEGSAPVVGGASMPGAGRGGAGGAVSLPPAGIGHGAEGSAPVAGGASMPGAGRGGAGGAVSLPPAGIGHGAEGSAPVAGGATTLPPGGAGHGAVGSGSAGAPSIRADGGHVGAAGSGSAGAPRLGGGGSEGAASAGGLPSVAVGEPAPGAEHDAAGLLAVEVARRALADAGYADRPFDRTRASVLFGTAGPRPGNVAAALGLGGTHATIAAGEASALAALDTACKELASGGSDLVLCGAADLHPAPTPNDGIGCLALKRLPDAERDGDRVYAVLKSVTAATGPNAPHQALTRAWTQAKVPPTKATFLTTTTTTHEATNGHPTPTNPPDATHTSDPARQATTGDDNPPTPAAHTPPPTAPHHPATAPDVPQPTTPAPPPTTPSNDPPALAPPRGADTSDVAQPTAPAHPPTTPGNDPPGLAAWRGADASDVAQTTAPARTVTAPGNEPPGLAASRGADASDVAQTTAPARTVTAPNDQAPGLAASRGAETPPPAAPHHPANAPDVAHTSNPPRTAVPPGDEPPIPAAPRDADAAHPAVARGPVSDHARAEGVPGDGSSGRAMRDAAPGGAGAFGAAGAGASAPERSDGRAFAGAGAGDESRERASSADLVGTNPGDADAQANPVETAGARSGAGDPVAGGGVPSARVEATGWAASGRGASLAREAWTGAPGRTTPDAAAKHADDGTFHPARTERDGCTPSAPVDATQFDGDGGAAGLAAIITAAFAVHTGVLPSAVHPRTAPGAVHPGDVPGTAHPGVAPGTVHTGAVPGAMQPGDVPGTVHPGAMPGAVHAGVVPGGGHAGVVPGAVRGGVAPGTVHAGVGRGDVHPGDVPGTVHPGAVPGVLHAGVGAGAVHPGAGPGGVHAGVGPGAVETRVGSGGVHLGGGPGAVCGVGEGVRAWLAAPEERYAGVGADADGTAFHAVIAGYGGAPEPVSGVAEWPAELFVVRGADDDAARNVLDRLAALARRPGVRLRDLARTCAESTGPVRAAFVATDVADVVASAERARAFRPGGGVFTGGGTSGAVAFLFPGGDVGRVPVPTDLFVAFPRSQRLLRHASAHRAGAAGVAVHRLLTELGVRPDLAAGHGYGELVALCAAGVIAEDDLAAVGAARAGAVLGAAAARGDSHEDRGAMAVVAASLEDVRAAIAEVSQVVVANHNAPRHVVVSGATPALERALVRLAEQGLDAEPVPAACAFHSPLVAGAATPLRRELARRDLRSPAFPVWSNATAAPYDADPVELAATLAGQVAAPVRFVEQIEAMYAAGARIFVEAGPGDTLTGFVRQILADRPHTAVACDVPGDPGVPRLLLTLAELAAVGVPVDAHALFAGRDAHVLDAAPPAPTWTVEGPVVRAPDGSRTAPAPPAPSADPVPQPSAETAQAVVEYLRATRELAAAQRDVVLGLLGAGPAHPHPPLNEATRARILASLPDLTTPPDPAPGPDASGPSRHTPAAPNPRPGTAPTRPAPPPSEPSPQTQRDNTEPAPPTPAPPAAPDALANDDEPTEAHDAARRSIDPSVRTGGDGGFDLAADGSDTAQQAPARPVGPSARAREDAGPGADDAARGTSPAEPETAPVELAEAGREPRRPADALPGEGGAERGEESVSVEVPPPGAAPDGPDAARRESRRSADVAPVGSDAVKRGRSADGSPPGVAPAWRATTGARVLVADPVPSDDPDTAAAALLREIAAPPTDAARPNDDATGEPPR
ncbi:acyltransferase domain-containing protein [Actinomadura flavalba]|uniref:acyltransferase domain-containing protein n=1 Tax=Actinomadura flavalba TaxID=1120938 RepID=UPI0003A28B9E|nr:acyltransferase domain-containing protein [Actinomadura flavalba]